MAPVMLPAQMTKADATRAKPVLGMPPGFELFRDSFDVLVRDESPLWAVRVTKIQRRSLQNARLWQGPLTVAHNGLTTAHMAAPNTAHASGVVNVPLLCL